MIYFYLEENHQKLVIQGLQPAPYNMCASEMPLQEMCLVYQAVGMGKPLQGLTENAVFYNLAVSYNAAASLYLYIIYLVSKILS